MKEHLGLLTYGEMGDKKVNQVGVELHSEHSWLFMYQRGAQTVARDRALCGPRKTFGCYHYYECKAHYFIIWVLFFYWAIHVAALHALSIGNLALWYKKFVHPWFICIILKEKITNVTVFYWELKPLAFLLEVIEFAQESPVL